MLLTVSILVALFCFIVKAVNGTTECLFGFCFGISYLCGVYFAYGFSDFYFSHKKKIQNFKEDLDSIFLREDFLLRFLQRENELRQQQQQQQQNTSEQLRADKTEIL